MASVSKRDFIILSFLSGNDFHSHENRTHLLKKKKGSALGLILQLKVF